MCKDLVFGSTTCDFLEVPFCSSLGKLCFDVLDLDEATASESQYRPTAAKLAAARRSIDLSLGILEERDARTTKPSHAIDEHFDRCLALCSSIHLKPRASRRPSLSLEVPG